MNARWKLAAATMFGLATLAACGSKDGTTTTTTTTPDGTKTTDTTTTTTGGPSVDSAKTAMSNAATNAKDATGNAMSNAKDSMSNMVAGAKDKMAGAGDHPVAQGNMDKVSQLIANKQYDAANLLLKQVEANKSKLPQSMQDQATSLRTQLDTAANK